MNLLKKWIGILCIFALCVSTLASCGEKETETPSVTEGTDKTEETTEDKKPSKPNKKEDPESVTTEDPEGGDTVLKGLELKTQLRMEAFERFRERLENAKQVKLDFSNPDSYVNKETDGNNLLRFTLRTDECGELNFEAEGVFLDENGKLAMHQGSSIVLLTEIPGMMMVDISVENESEEGFFGAKEGFSPSKSSKVTSSNELIYNTSGMVPMSDNTGTYRIELYMEAGYITLDPRLDCTLSQVIISYSGETRGTRDMILDTAFYGMYAEGEYYNSSLEDWNADEEIFDFYLKVIADTEMSEYLMEEDFYYVRDKYTIGDLHAKDGAVKAKTEPLAIGDYLDVTVLGVTYPVTLPVHEKYYPDSLYDGCPAAVSNGVGDLNVLVVPFYFEEQKDQLASDYEDILNVLGNAVLSDGKTVNREAVSDYFTLSDYYEKASYGKLNITSYVTDWYCLEEGTFEERKTGTLYEEERAAIEKWVSTEYASWTEALDQDQDGLFDAVILICASDKSEDEDFYPISIGGAVQMIYSYGNACAKDDRKVINKHVLINVKSLYQENGSKFSGSTLLHEFGHGLGLIDYYDVTYSGMNALGGYDMQCDNTGDWNPASKYIVGWITPTVLTKEQLSQGGTYTISAFEESGDVLLIPISGESTDGTYNPFNEYIMIDLFTPDGLHQYSAPEAGLTKAGVRIYHVDAHLLKIDLMKDWYEEGTAYEMSCFNSYNSEGRYFVQLLQAGGRNTFVDPENYEALSDRDFFQAGDSFSESRYAACYPNGLTHNRSEFPYTITVKSIENGTATLEIK